MSLVKRLLIARIFACGLLMMGLAVVWGQARMARAQAVFTPTSHLRAGYYGTWGDARDGSLIDDHSLSGRLRVGATWQPTSSALIRGSVSSRFASTQDRWHLRGLGYHPGSGGYAAGDIGVDLLHARWTPSPQWRVDAGRLRLGFGLPDMMGRGLHRNDGTNISVQWTDGVHVRHQLTETSTAHIAAFHTPNPPTTAFRSPLSFTDSGSRVGLFGVLQSTQVMGPLTHQAVQVSVLPSAIPTNSGDTGDTNTYVAVSVQGAAETSVGAEARFVAATEVGWVPTPLSNDVLGLEKGISPDPVALQASINLLDVRGAHSFALQGGLFTPHWLISTDFRPNEWMSEARYYWRFHENFRFDVRFRLRQERWQQVDAVQRRTQYDTYVRLNVYLP